MCILIVKPAGKIAPSDEILKRCFDANPDGAGICYEKNGTIVIKKGLMDFQSFSDAVKKIPVDSSALLHCRIGTSGGNIPELTHPYPLTNDIKQLKKTSLTLKPRFDGEKVYAVGHNGIFYGLGEKGSVNDTCMFIANILTPLKESVNELLSDKLAPVINQLVDTSRIAIMDNYGNIRIFGSGWEEQDGIYYSNSGYKEHKWVTTYTCSNGKTYQYSYDDYDDDYDDYYSGKKTKTKGNWKNYTTSYQELVEQFGSWDNYFAWRNLEDNEKVEELARMYPDDADWIFDYYDEGNTSPEELREWLYDTYEIK